MNYQEGGAVFFIFAAVFISRGRSALRAKIIKKGQTFKIERISEVCK